MYKVEEFFNVTQLMLFLNENNIKPEHIIQLSDLPPLDSTYVVRRILLMYYDEKEILDEEEYL